MRVAVVMTLLLLCACASEQLALAPPPGVDFSGHWKLNESDSDDPQRLALSQIAGPAGAARSGGQGGQGGRGGRQGGRSGGDVGSGGGPVGPSLPVVGALGAGLRWPGKEIEIKQIAGVVAITSGGRNRVYQPSADQKPQHVKSDGAQGRDMRAQDLGDGPALCGWQDKTLVVQAGAPDDDHPPFEQRYSVSDDGQRLIEVVGFKGGRLSGFTLSRVWDRVLPGASPPRAGPDPTSHTQ